MKPKPLQDVSEHEALKLILAGTSRETGQEFFRALVRSLATALRTDGAWVTELESGGDRLKAFAMWLGGEWVDAAARFAASTSSPTPSTPKAAAR